MGTKKRKRKKRKRKRQSKRTNKMQRTWEKKKVGRPNKPKKVGDRVSFKLLNGKRVTGKVIGVQKHYYKVLRKGKIYRVNRDSILYQVGHAIGATVGKIRGAVKATAAGYKTEKEAEKIFEQVKRRKRLAEIRQKYG